MYMISYVNVKLILTATNEYTKIIAKLENFFLLYFQHELITAKKLNNFQLSVQTCSHVTHPSIHPFIGFIQMLCASRHCLYYNVINILFSARVACL